MKYKVTNKTFSPLQLYEIGVIPARKSIMLDEISDRLRIMEKKSKISIKAVKEN